MSNTAQIEEKFIVINKKRLVELNEVTTSFQPHPMCDRLLTLLEEFKQVYENDFGKKLDQKYWVVNQDEPYADQVRDIILKHETQKQKEDHE